MASSSSWVAPAGSGVTTDHRTRVIGELSRGREVAGRLRLMLRDNGSSVLPAHHGLVGEILDSFTQSLSILSCAAGVDSDEVSQVPTPKSEDSGESCKTPAPKDRRGCYKRRRTSETRIQDTPTPFDDGHAWRKYGQKVILHAKYPRNYFRCTHKFDQGCQASKQVQKIQDDPPLFRTTYHGQHSCRNLIKSPHQIIMDSTAQDSSTIWFGSRELAAGSTNTTGVVIDDYSNTAVSINAIKREYYNNQTKSSSSPLSQPDYFVTPVLSAAFDHLGVFSSGSEHADVISCTESTHSMDPYIIDGPDFDGFLQFET